MFGEVHEVTLPLSDDADRFLVVRYWNEYDRLVGRHLSVDLLEWRGNIQTTRRIWDHTDGTDREEAVRTGIAP